MKWQNDYGVSRSLKTFEFAKKTVSNFQNLAEKYKSLLIIPFRWKKLHYMQKKLSEPCNMVYHPKFQVLSSWTWMDKKCAIAPIVLKNFKLMLRNYTLFLVVRAIHIQRSRRHGFLGIHRFLNQLHSGNTL